MVWKILPSSPLFFFSRKERKKGIKNVRKQEYWEVVEENKGLKALFQVIEISRVGTPTCFQNEVSWSEIDVWVIFYNSDKLKESVPGCNSKVNWEPVEVLLISNFCLFSLSQSFAMSRHTNTFDEVKSI